VARKIPNAALGLGLAAMVVVMFGFAYANVPLFKLFCERFGIGNTGKAAVRGGPGGPGGGPERISSATGAIQNRDVQVKFMGVASTGLPVRFGPSASLIHVVPGRPVHLDYTFTNMSDDSVFFRAVHSVAPQRAAREFQLIQCFCFEDQTLGPRETRVLPVYFALSPRTPGDINEVQLSYTLFPRDEKDELAGSARKAN
jgi:cytochrome c oxidase assembly protein subunit 11